MTFSEALKASVKKRAHLRCCVCHLVGVDTHHIVPKAEGGTDEEDNAAPLCPSCHDTYGANPQKRRFIREAREVWYEICAAQTNTEAEQLAGIKEMLQNLATKEDIARLAVQNNGVVLGDTSGPTASPKSPYAFERNEFVNPLIVRELLGWLSDPVATVVAVDLTASNRSNRFWGDFSQSCRDGRTWINWAGEKGEWFAYAHIATSPSGIHMVECLRLRWWQWCVWLNWTILDRA